MLEIRLNCENCNKSLESNSLDAMICSFECTFCFQCVNDILKNVCPNCGGGFEKRPIRPKEKLVKNPPSSSITFKPIQIESFDLLLNKNQFVLPKDR